MTTLSSIRRGLLGVLAFGLAGAIAELLLLEHYEDALQLAPLFLIGAAMAVLAWHVARPHVRSLRALQVVMLFFVLAGGTGVVLHYRGAAEFQLEMDKSQHGWPLFQKAMRAKAPPVLAPGLMMQLGLVGLLYSYRHPSVSPPAPAAPRGME